MSGPGCGDGFDNADLQLFESGDLADSTIVCGDRTWNVHKVILSSRCKWFKAAFYGKLSEAASGRIELQEQDANLVDMLLRFIYAKDINIPKLAKGRNLPVLCVQLFRLGDFFQLAQLKNKAVKEVDAYFQSPEKIPTIETGGKQSPKWLTEILDAVKEAYKDRSTAAISQTLVKLVYNNKTKIFRFHDAMKLLDDFPEVGKDLMKNHLSKDLTPPKTQLGLRVVSAVKSEEARGSKGLVTHLLEKPCLLYPYIVGYEAGSGLVDAFRPVYSVRDYEFGWSLKWLSPRAHKVFEMTSHPDSEICKLRSTVGWNNDS